MAFTRETNTLRVSIVKVESDKVTVKTNTGGRFDVPVMGGTLPEVPRVGDLWLITETTPRNWTLVSKYVAGREMSLTKFGVEVYAQSCVGIEDTVIQNLVKMGVDEVFILVGSSGSAWWDSKVAALYEIIVGTDVLSSMASRAKAAGLGVYAVIDHDILRGDAYSQHDFLGNSTESTSPLNGRAAMAAMVAEVTANPYVDGVVLRGFGYTDSTFDYSAEMVAAFVAKKGVTPPTTADTTSAAFWVWQEFRELMWNDFFDAMRGAVASGGQLLALARDNFWFSREGSLGRVDHGLADGFCDSGSFDSAGVDLSYTSPAEEDDELALGVVECSLALVARMARHPRTSMSVEFNGATSEYRLRRMMALAVDYGVAHVVLYDYDNLLAARAPLATRADLTAVMADLRTRTVRERPTAGFLCSSDTRDVSQPQMSTYAASVQTAIAAFSASTDYPIEILLDADLERIGDSGIRTLVMLDTQNMTDAVVSAVHEWNLRQDKHLVVIGRCGNKVGRSAIDTEIYPFWGGRAKQMLEPIGETSVSLSVLSPIMPSATITAQGWRSLCFYTRDSMMLTNNEEHSIGLARRFTDTGVPFESRFRAKNRFGDTVSPAWAAISPTGANVSPFVTDVSATATGTSAILKAKVVDYEHDQIVSKYICKVDSIEPTQAEWDAASLFVSPQVVGGLAYSTDYHLWVYAVDALHFMLSEGATVSAMQTVTSGADTVAPTRVVGYATATVKNGVVT